jgi:hypothetical protein
MPKLLIWKSRIAFARFTGYAYRMASFTESLIKFIWLTLNTSDGGHVIRFDPKFVEDFTILVHDAAPGKAFGPIWWGDIVAVTFKCKMIVKAEWPKP